MRDVPIDGWTAFWAHVVVAHAAWPGTEWDDLAIRNLVFPDYLHLFPGSDTVPKNIVVHRNSQ
jgi:hypothetical protein